MSGGGGLVIKCVHVSWYVSVSNGVGGGGRLAMCVSVRHDMSVSVSVTVSGGLSIVCVHVS